MCVCIFRKYPKQVVKPEKLAFVLPVTTRTNTQRQGLNLYVHFLQMAGDLRRWWVVDPKRRSYISFEASLFVRRRQVYVRDLEFRKEVNQIKAAVWQFL